MNPIELTAAQREDYWARPCKEKPEGFSFPEDLLPSCTRVDSSITLMTLVTCFLELLPAWGSYVLWRRFWGCFRATLGPDNPLYRLNWSRAESLVSCLSWHCRALFWLWGAGTVGELDFIFFLQIMFGLYFACFVFALLSHSPSFVGDWFISLFVDLYDHFVSVADMSCFDSASLALSVCSHCSIQGVQHLLREPC